MLKNYMEEVVEFLLPTVLDKYDNICKCERCIRDIKALSLNNLKPLYVATEKGNIYAKVKELNTQFRADTIKVITEAIEIVCKSPRHI
ncbi:late competence development ComFB family protein [Clostridium lundense]|uniref:late competence development ComFB family protein n=1 Tax=Clostridium lundense TaxID=319475 RepID=UPI000488360E|nr:competence protein ComFB [Clostridium lundense]